MRLPLVFAFTLLAAACASSSEEVSTTEQHATADEDIEIARLRADMQRAEPMYFDNRVIASALAMGSTDVHGMQFRWNCSRREAGRNDGTLALPTFFEMTPNGANANEAINIGDGYGQQFVRDAKNTNEMIGYPAVFTPGGLQRFQMVRVKKDGGLIMEDVVRAGVGLNPSEQATWDGLQSQYDRAIASDGLAVAYVACNQREAVRDHLPIGFFDDFKDPGFSARFWSISGGNLTNGGVELEDGDHAELYGNGAFDHVSLTLGSLPAQRTLDLFFDNAHLVVLNGQLGPIDPNAERMSVVVGQPIELTFGAGKVVVSHVGQTEEWWSPTNGPITGTLSFQVGQSAVVAPSRATITRLELNRL